jgi:hypothetical protein
MSYCEHCHGQRFDRARVLRALRQIRKDLRQGGAGKSADNAINMALSTVLTLEIPHLELLEPDEEVVH